MPEGGHLPWQGLFMGDWGKGQQQAAVGDQGREGGGAGEAAGEGQARHGATDQRSQ